MEKIFLIAFNIILVSAAIYLFSKRNLLSYASGGKWWLTWLAIGVITLMDELTSIFYAPSEAYRSLGLAALFFIPVTGVFIRYLTTRMVEIAEILDVHSLKGGGVYNFSYLVLGPIISFVAVASIIVDYVLTAAISTVSAVENASFYFNLDPHVKLAVEIGLIWMVAGLNISGIHNNARVTFGIFLFTAIIFLNVIVGGFFNFGSANWDIASTTTMSTLHAIGDQGFFHGFSYIVMGLSSCILAYSGVESVLQTAGLMENWKVTAKAYLFLALSVGIVTPVVSFLVLSSPNIDFRSHETDLIVHYTSTYFGPLFSTLVIIVASLTLLMAVNTAFVATSELIERVAHRYSFTWIVKTNRMASLYRIHIASALFFSIIVYFTQGTQQTLAHMYAIGLLASFMIQLLSLLIYRYAKGTKEVSSYHVSRFGTFFLFVFIVSCFVYLSYHKPEGFLLWLGTTLMALVIGIYGTKRRAPELHEVKRGETPMDLIFYIAESDEKNVHIHFKRPFDTPQEKTYDRAVFITFYSPRQPIPERSGESHFRIPFKRASIHHNTLAILELLQYELPDKNITVHFGWPTSSWFDRISIGVMVFQLLRLPKMFPKINFKIENFKTH